MYPLSPLDGRYQKKVAVLSPYFSEEALMKARVEVEIFYFLALAEEPKVRELKRVTGADRAKLMKIIDQFGA